MLMSRRSFLATAVAGLSIARLALPHAASAATGCLVGSYSDRANTSLEASLGRRLYGQRANFDLHHGTQVPQRLIDAFDQGRRFSYHDTSSQPAYTWGEVAAGADDARYLALFSAIVKNGRWSATVPYHLSFDHEQVVNQNGTPAEYQAAFQRVRSLAASRRYLVGQGGPIAMVYTPTLSQYKGIAKNKAYNAALCDPGSAHYELLGVDGYNRSPSGHLDDVDPVAWVAPVAAYAAKVGKPFMFGELGIGAAPERPAFVTGLFNHLKTVNCVAVLYSDVTGKQPYYLDSDAATLAAARGVLNDPYLMRRSV